MVGRKIIKQMAGWTAALMMLTGCAAGSPTDAGAGSSGESSKVIQIGITQIVEHPALDAAREGFIEGMKEEGYEEGKNIKYELQNAQGEIPTAQMIAQNFVNNKKDLILAIATPTAQATYQTTKDIPIVITAVTDPVEAGLAQSMEKPGTNVTGTSDMTPIGKQFKMLQEILPSAKKVGILYNTSEANSILQVKIAKEAAKELGLEIVEAGITAVNEVQQAAEALAGKVDVIYVPTDNTVVSAMAIVVNTAIKKGIPVIGSEKGQVENGALATEGIDYFKLGKQTAKIAAKILKGEKPADLAIETLEETELVINQATAERLKIEIPASLKEKATFVGK